MNYISVVIHIAKYLIIPLITIFLFYRRNERLSKDISAGKYFCTDEIRLIYEAVNYYFLLVIALVCFGTQIGLTTFRFNIPAVVFKELYGLTWLFVAVKLAILLYYNHHDTLMIKTDTDHLNISTKYTFKNLKECLRKNIKICLCLLSTLVFYLAFPSEHYLHQQYIAPLIIGCFGINIKKIIAAAFVPSALVIIVMIFASHAGAIQSLVKNEKGLRSYWGHISPTDFGTAVLMMTSFTWMILKDAPEELFILPSLFSLFISFYVTRATTSGYLSLLFIGMLIFRAFNRRISKKTTVFKHINKLINMAAIFAFPLLGLIVIIMVWFYLKEMSFAISINSIFHGRLKPAAEMLSRYGLKPFGTYFDMHGRGGSTVFNGNPYNFIDSSYPQILIRYGYVTYITANVLWIYVTAKALSAKNEIVAYVMTLSALDFVMEHHWYELSYNIFILFPFADFIGSDHNFLPVISESIESFKQKLSRKRYAVVFTAACIFHLFIIFLMLPVAFTWHNTVLFAMGIHGGGIKGAILFLIITAVFTVIVIFVWNISSIAADIAIREKVAVLKIIAIICSVLLGAAWIITGEAVIKKTSNAYRATINSERDVLELVIATASGKIYADKIPEIYIRNIKGMDRSYFNGEDFARFTDVTVITDASWDSQCLTENGFLYLQISDKDAIYTNDNSVITALNEEGYTPEKINTFEHMVNLQEMAELNDLTLLDDGSINLDGMEHQLLHGPYIELYEGKFIGRFKLRLMDNGKARDGKVCQLVIAAYSGKEKRAEVEVYTEDFSKEGILDCEIPFSGEGQNYEFLVFPENGANVNLESISYRRVQDFDSYS